MNFFRAKIFILIILCATVVVALFLFKKMPLKEIDIGQSPILNRDKNYSDEPEKENNVVQPQEISPSQPPKESKKILAEKDVLLDVPFTAQAPFGDWKDPRQQDGCEEASAIMAMAWVRGEKLTPQIALEKILAISEYELKNYGNYQDTDAEDTAKRIFKGYFGYDKIKVRHGISTQDIKTELFKGNLVIIPVNGRKLGNPYYTLPGPQEHNLVIRGYDAAKNEFITNDPGTRQGEDYRYKESVIENALQDYPTGFHEPIAEKKTAMIVVEK